MNYRHIYHAGNFADVLKHAVLARLVTYLGQKDKAFRVIDTHAGIGLYDLASEEAQKTGEWLDGIGRLLAEPLPTAVEPLLAPYLAAVRAVNEGDRVTRYPGSPMIVRHLLRSQDRLSALELHPDDYETLHRLFDGDFQVRVTHLDGWLSLGAHLPPKEKRGLVLVDPPFEKEGEYERLVDGLEKAHRRFPGGTYCLWYPLKRGAPIEDFYGALRESGIPKMIAVELSVRSDRETTGLSGSGLIIVNPPFTLERELAVLLPFLKERLAQDRFAGTRVVRLAGENG
ncbi:23S rRNA (adenine2030-N6)-methyltransferase [Rhizobium sp. RU20A]|uniref:23S rRNA (adenine(2030)-N(6))-methyltransferase RlmJ n=1 Tax=Rhizobium sp. RU20A TaxID=1907412 RepID=UPI0009566B87|nr:23S rRNA (adenine(2030)-N(6))-methyltransferase RlmJ [Rhizobium sp. RU20A]SIP94393.1 23S rRNA (adenine2030-N6)-methyltransferase [Rhizobium sp. RU20A]